MNEGKNDMKTTKTVVVIGMMSVILWYAVGFAQPGQPPRQGQPGGPRGEQYLVLLKERLQLDEQ